MIICIPINILKQCPNSLKFWQKTKTFNVYIAPMAGEKLVKNLMHVHFKNNTLLLDTFTFDSNKLCEKMLDKGISKLLNGKN